MKYFPRGKKCYFLEKFCVCKINDPYIEILGQNTSRLTESENLLKPLQKIIASHIFQICDSNGSLFCSESL